MWLIPPPCKGVNCVVDSGWLFEKANIARSGAGYQTGADSSGYNLTSNFDLYPEN